MPPSDPDGVLWRDLPATPRDPPVAVHIRAAALAAVQAHLHARPNLEQIGLLFGRFGAGSVLQIEHVTPLSAASTPVHVLMDRRAWPSVWNALPPMATHPEPEQGIVGWYHSHPGHGVFLSATDLATHALWFASSGGVALVLDPHSGALGCFSLLGPLPMQIV